MGTGEGNQLRAKDILTNANDTIINRGSTHGHYDHTMLRTAKLWEAYFERPIEPMDIAICMALVKLARTMETKSNPDNFLDAVSYWAIAGSLAVKDWNDLDA